MTADLPQSLYVALAVVSTFIAGAIATSIYAAVERRRRERRGRVDGRAHVGTLRARNALVLLGDALAATHNPNALLSVILDATLEATGAPAATILADHDRLLTVGEPTHEEPLIFALTEESAPESLRLLLYPPEGGLAPDVQQLASSIARQGRVALDNARLHRVVEEQALTDDLTGLPNRRRFVKTLALEVRRTQRFGGDLSLILADLDEFKQINDRYGHESGDLVLQQVAKILRASLREIDLPARLGGEEFGIIVPETGSRGARAAAERLRKALKSHPIDLPSIDRIVVTASFGISSFPAETTPEALLRAADLALYRAKAEGKDRTIGGDP
jgi:diguanylate cyclase (GGDEF)-like protein